jgi:hypothetical protein
VQLPNGNVAASYAGLVLEYRGATLQEAENYLLMNKSMTTVLDLLG